MDPDESLRIEDFVPAPGGEWHGLLFDNPSTGLPPRLTWCFTFPFADVERDDDESPLSLTVEWVPVPAESWRRFAGRRVASASFAEPAEASVYYYLHHRFDAVTLDLAEQRGGALRVVAEVSGDLDRLGVDPVRAEAWLTFTGILVSLHDAASPDVALARLGAFTDTDGLAYDPGSRDGVPRFTAQPDELARTLPFPALG
ncbi:hypothetical protein SAMN05421812_107323 [Asanoa hainanensis]|uniref:Uncharacterized protein n=1 Tax=Asanoa hainanensis TaxID=560556 RepID=A0A239N703_9ACTN|nr:hypothetical protein [Asanoa hainanensis]SNT50510.1 hypothetical protein SAMN05421812_107323 [Asanoa hainanensis]